MIGDTQRHRPEFICSHPHIRKELGNIPDFQPKQSEPIVICMSCEQLLVFLKGTAAAGAVGYDILTVKPDKEIEIDQGKTPGGFPIALGQVGSAAAFHPIRSDDIETLVGENAGGLPGNLGEYEAHRTTKEEGHAATLLSLRWGDGWDIETERPAERGEQAFHPCQDAGKKPVDPETVNSPLDTESLVEPDGQE
jgi:hypothetical protein